MGVPLDVVTLTSNYGSIHGVPEAKLASMAIEFISHEDLISEHTVCGIFFNEVQVRFFLNPTVDDLRE